MGRAKEWSCDSTHGGTLKVFGGCCRSSPCSSLSSSPSLCELLSAIIQTTQKNRNGAKVKRTYYPPATPCDRLLKHPAVDEQIKEKLRLQRKKLDPVELLHRIREGQSALAALASTDSSPQGPGRESLDQFMAQLSRLWQAGEVRPTHRTQSSKPRHWRTRKDPFEAVWYDVLYWLQQEPDVTAKALFERLQDEYPGHFPDGQLRTLQRRVREWRTIMARKLVYACIDGNEKHY